MATAQGGYFVSAIDPASPDGDITVFLSDATRDLSEDLSEEEHSRRLAHGYARRAVERIISRDTLGLFTVVKPEESRRTTRFDVLRKQGKKLGEINQILEAEGFSEVSGEGVMPCPTKHHEIIKANQSAKKLCQTVAVP